MYRLENQKEAKLKKKYSEKDLLLTDQQKFDLIKKQVLKSISKLNNKKGNIFRIMGIRSYLKSLNILILK